MMINAPKKYYNLPKHPYPIILVGAGGIVNDAHLPAYKIAGFQVHGIYDLKIDKARNLAKKFSIPNVYATIEQMIADAPEKVIYDIAVPGNAIADVLRKLPDGTFLQMQKPMGEDLEQAKEILQVTREKKMIAGVNCQLRYAPYINEARMMIDDGLVGTLTDIEININVFTPWHLWSFLFGAPRMEIPYHSIHYIDLVRSFLGNPNKIYARTIKHPSMEKLASVKSNIYMDYGDYLRANIITNHCHDFGLKNQHAYVKFEGTEGVIIARLGVLMNYPKGVEDKFEYAIKDEDKEPEWHTKDIPGTWFPHAFIGSMNEIQKAATGMIKQPNNSVEDCIDTMVCVEATYVSDSKGGVKPDFLNN